VSNYTCTMCANELDVYSDNPTQPLDGLHLRFMFGYGMFTDSEEGSTDAVICHACSIRVLELFPEAFKEQFKRGHASGYGDCTGCEYSYLEFDDSSAEESDDICPVCNTKTYSMECACDWIPQAEPEPEPQPIELELGQIVVTKALWEHLVNLYTEELEIMKHLAGLLNRHKTGDWGEVDPGDAQSNRDAVQEGERVMSVYTLNDTRVWVITEWDRSVTTVMLPEDY